MTVASRYKDFRIVWYRPSSTGPVPETETVQSTSKSRAKDYGVGVAKERGWRFIEVCSINETSESSQECKENVSF